jgi:hypothetical protein
VSEMIERVAKAIAETIALAHIKHNLREIGQEDQIEEYLKMFPIKLTLADSEVARAAIEAMREPSMEMCSAGEESGFLHWSPEEGEGLDEVDMAVAYRAMIDAALDNGK